LWSAREEIYHSAGIRDFCEIIRPDGRDSYISFPTEKLKVEVEKRGWKHWEFKLNIP
jgi:hypothetical protein